MIVSEKSSSTSTKWQDKHLALVRFLTEWAITLFIYLNFFLICGDIKTNTFIKWLYAHLEYILSHPEQDTSRIYVFSFLFLKKKIIILKVMSYPILWRINRLKAACGEMLPRLGSSMYKGSSGVSHQRVPNPQRKHFALLSHGDGQVLQQQHHTERSASK